MAISVEIAPNILNQDNWIDYKDIVIIKFPDNTENETEIYIQYNTVEGRYDISCFTKGDEDHTTFEYYPITE